MKQSTVSECSRLWSSLRGSADTTNRIGSSGLNENAYFNAKGFCISRIPLFVSKAGNSLWKDMDRDLLHQAAEKWINLTDYRYIFTYGYKKKLHTLTLCFTSSDFAHLADFHYMKDVTTPQYYSRKLPQKILDESIDTAPFLQAAQFDEMVVPRLHAIIRLKDSLDNDFTLFKYNPNFYSFYTSIKADYLITSHSTNTDFVFIIHSQEDSASMEYTCCSIFEQGQRDYEEGQRERTLLKKERIYIPENHSDILFDRLSSPTSKD